MMTTVRGRGMDGKKGEKKKTKKQLSVLVLRTAVMVVSGGWCDTGVARATIIPATAQQQDVTIDYVL